MGHICSEPKILMESIFKGCWLCTKKPLLTVNNGTQGAIPMIERVIIYDGTGLGIYDGNEIEFDLFWILKTYDFIEQDSGNFDFKETFYHFNKDFLIEHRRIVLDLLQKSIDDKDWKNKYKNLIRKHKFDRILKNG